MFQVEPQFQSAYLKYKHRYSLSPYQYASNARRTYPARTWLISEFCRPFPSMGAEKPIKASRIEKILVFVVGVFIYFIFP